VFSRRFQILRLLGFPIYLDLSWFVLAILITWSLATSLFPMQIQGLAPATYWLMGAAGALGLFVSILLHELGHCVVARQFGVRIRGITLFIFGGVAEMEDEPPSPRSEFLVAAAGPFVSVLIALTCFGVVVAVPDAPSARPVTSVAAYLAWINGLLVVFNLLPAFPLDGGRMFRALLWYWKDNLRWATRVTSEVGSWFGLTMIALGIWTFIGGNFIGGMWWFLIGMFLRRAAQMSYQQLIIRRTLEGEPVNRFMVRDPVVVPPGTTIEALVEQYVYRHYFKMYPVGQDGRLFGAVTLRQVKDVPRERWPEVTVDEIASPCTAENVIGPDADAMEALSQMSRHGASRLMVVERDRLVGIITLKDLMQFLATRIELEP
jgi:Zn-dependent protease